MFSCSTLVKHHWKHYNIMSLIHRRKINIIDNNNNVGQDQVLLLKYNVSVTLHSVFYGRFLPIIQAIHDLQYSVFD